MKMKYAAKNRITNHVLFDILRSMVVDLVPVFLVGITAELLTMVPVPAYQSFIQVFAGGLIYRTLNTISFVTFGVQSAHVLFFYTRHICLEKNINQIEQLGKIVSAISIFCIFMNINLENSQLIERLGPRGMVISFGAITFSYSVYDIVSKLTKKSVGTLWISNIGLSIAVRAMLPITITIFIGVVFNHFVGLIWNTGSVSGFITYGVTLFFETYKGTEFGEMALLFLSTVLWFFGIHGSKAIEGIFYSVMMTSATEGSAIFTQAFITTFVLMGGCGATLCLVIAYIIAAKKKKYKIETGQKVAFGISLLNINEFIVFGLPIIYNVKLMIPFFTVPLVFYSTSYAATYFGFIPKTSVEEAFWVTPVLISGYLATGTIKGALVQLMNLILGTAIYYPFVVNYIVNKKNLTKDYYAQLLEQEKINEISTEKSDLLSVYSPYADVSNSLLNSLKGAVSKDDIQLYYQPQYDSSGHCVGAEALLRFEHPDFGFVYPPLLIEVAKQAGILTELEKTIIRKALADAMMLRSESGREDIKISANVTGDTIQSEAFMRFLADMSGKYDIRKMKFTLEVTEQDFLKIDDQQRARFRKLHDYGYRFSIDDFSMGSTSLNYLTADLFDAIKIDGGLVKQVATNERAMSVVSSIINLAQSLKMKTVAEFVSDETILNKLRSLGCEYYQGWYYSPAVEKEKLLDIFKKESEPNT